MKAWVFWVVCVTGCVILYSLIAPGSGLLPECPFYRLTHLYCPGCGSQRAVHALLHGRFVQAAGFNPLLVLSLLYFAVEAGIWFRQNAGINTNSLSSHVRTPYIVLAVVLVFWVLRNIPVPPFTLLAPA